jgi:hypothetical protein
MQGTLESLPKFSLRVYDTFASNLPEFLPEGGNEILWGKRNFGDCKRMFEQAVVEALI